MNKQELKKMFDEGLISRQEFGVKLAEIEMRPKKKQSKRIYEAISESDFIKILEALPHKKDGNMKQTTRLYYLALVLAYGSGLRKSEILSLKPEEINLKEHKIFLRQAKGAKDRIVNTPRWMKQEDLKLFPLKITSRSLNAAFLKASMKSGVNKILYTDKAGRPRFRYFIHSLRHSFATRAIEKGVPINQVQLLLGHASLSTTSKYVQANPVDAIQSVLDKGV